MTSSPAGINCGSTCSAQFASGSVVTLTATPSGGGNFGSTFTGWSGGGCSGTGTCQVTLNSSTTVTANFSFSFFSRPDAARHGLFRLASLSRPWSTSR